MFKKFFYRFSGLYGIVHAIGCPYHGLLGLFILMGLFIPASIVSIAQYPHSIVSERLIEPVFKSILNEGENVPFLMRKSKRYAHITTDILGWTMYGVFAIMTFRKFLVKRNVECNNTKCSHNH
jgi:hypothetical protein